MIAVKNLPNFRLDGDVLDSGVFNGEFVFSKLDCLFVTEPRGFLRGEGPKGEDRRLPA